MDQKDNEHLLQQYINSRISEEKLRMLMNKIEAGSDDEIHDKILKEYWQDLEEVPELNEFHSDKLYGHIQNRIQQNEGPAPVFNLKKNNNAWWWSAAAALSGISLLGTFLYFGLRNNEPTAEQKFRELTQIAASDSCETSDDCYLLRKYEMTKAKEDSLKLKKKNK